MGKWLLLALVWAAPAQAQERWDNTTCRHVQEMVDDIRANNWGTAQAPVLLSILAYQASHCGVDSYKERQSLVSQIRKMAQPQRRAAPQHCMIVGAGEGNADMLCD